MPDELGLIMNGRFPVDYDALRKGDVIEPDRIAAIVGAPPRSYEYSYRLAALQKQVQDALWERDRPYTVTVVKLALHILDDASAVRYNAARFLKLRRGLGRAHQRLVAVDVALLDPDQKAHYDRAVKLQGTTLAAILAAHKAVAPQAVERQTPMLPGAAEGPDRMAQD